LELEDGLLDWRRCSDVGRVDHRLQSGGITVKRVVKRQRTTEDIVADLFVVIGKLRNCGHGILAVTVIEAREELTKLTNELKELA
jgi:hypothetical protein